ncbi:MAG: FtsX-like permease family protein [Cyanobacteria bacterium]|nr:FtsX-like permease family protein [Cyanobacteria bacterium CG_2015-16_32_12]NCO76983.1 FtsX-like permease family protein [Cyanobacteria bacterium CG_2015-22_32_23]NCQ03669.1 FtsX-like permease family protein [Cyanobacteria bacterium CG_2015-09_32_10]NCQ40923.1 FtsX-like permease family protein [Cyanobacteria bacterium CG_2015-04_32_10]
MKITDSVKMAITTLLANKMRSSLTMLGIIIGNASVISMIGIGQAAQKLASDQFESLGANVLFIVPGSRESRRTTFDTPKTLVLDDAEAIAEQVPSITEVSPQINSRLLVTYGNKNNSASIIGVTPEFLTVRNFDVAQGRFINSSDLKRNHKVVILGSQIAEDFFSQENPIGKSLRIKNVSFEVIGIMESKGSFLGTNQDETLYIPLTTMANQIIGKTSQYGLELSIINVTAKDPNDITAARFQIENLLRLRHKIVGEDDFRVETQKDILSIVGTVTGGLTIMLGAIAAISLLVGGIGVMNIMLVSVSERTQEIGLRKAIGATENNILLQFLIEAIIISAVGGLVGTLIGVGGLTIIGLVSPLPTNISMTTIGLAVGVSGGIGLFFGVVPAQQAAKLDPIVALRSA